MDFSSMASSFLASLGELFEPTTFLLLVIGVLIGSVVGLLPGIGSIATLALMLPFTFSMSPFEAFALMLGMYAVTTTTGDLTAILFGIPGDPGCAALVMDGYPMTQQGMAKRAMSADVVAGTIGAIIGAATLALVVPVIRPVILHVGAPETLMLTLIGVVVVATVSGRSLLRGVIAGGFGLLLAAVGPNPQSGIVRYGFDWIYLLDGIPLVAFTIGLFGIPEIVGLHRSRSAVAGTSTPDGSSALQGLRDAIRYRSLVVRSSLVGIGLGIIPGVGSSVGQWAAYAHAQHTSKNPEKFGKGSIEGVIAPGATNNSKEGAGLIPTIAFGVPNGGAMAVLLGAFLILGLSPGPSMLTTNLNVTFFMVWVLVAANIIGSALCLIFLGPLAKVTFLRGELLVPFIVILVFLGAASVSGQIEDLGFALAAGFLAMVMRHFGWPVVPMILGFVLGDGAETNLNISMGAYGWGWLLRPAVLALMVVVAGFLWLSLRQRRKATIEVDDEDEKPRQPGTVGGLAVAGVALAVGIVAVVAAAPWPSAARLYPQTIGAVIIAGALFVVAGEVRAMLKRGRRPAEAVVRAAVAEPVSEGVLVAEPAGRAPATVEQGAGGGAAVPVPPEILRPSRAGGTSGVAGDDAAGDGAAARGDGGASRGDGAAVAGSAAGWRRVLELVAAPTRTVGIAWILAGALGVWLWGFSYTAPVLVLLYERLVAKQSWIRCILLALAMAALVYLLFVEVLDIPLPQGLFWS